MDDKKSPAVLEWISKILGNPTFIVIIALIIFASIYVCQTERIRTELNNVLKIKTDTIMLELKSITNSSVTNTFTIDEASISKLESSIENILRLENAYTREYVNQIIKNSTDVTTFWLAFLSMFMVIFSLFSIYTNNNILKKTEEEAKAIIEKLTKKSDEAIEKLKVIETSTKESEEKAEESKKEAKITIEELKIKVEQESKTIIKKLTKEYDKAIEELKAIKKSTEKSKKEAKISENKAKSESLFIQGLKAYEEKKYDDAVRYYTEAIELNRDNSGAYNNRGCAYDKLKDYYKAIDDYSKTIDLNPKYSLAYNNRGIVYGRQEEYDLAIADFNKAIELDPKDSEAYNNRGYVYYKQNQYEESIKDFEKVPIDMIKSDEESLDAIKGMAKKGNERAIEFCKKNNIEY